MVDLHLHSLHSDGSDSPAALVAQGASLGLHALALTDHDTVSGVAEFLDAARERGIPATSGVELSTQFEQAELHLLGYGFDPENPGLLALLERGRRTRRERNLRMLARLAELGCPLDYAEVESIAGNPETVGRPHIAETLVRRGHVADVREAFERFLGPGAAAYIPRERFTTEEGIRVLHEAGGVAVWAHPHAGFSAASVRKILATLVPAGLDGLEAYHPRHSDGKIASALTIAHEHGLFATGGSDYHGSFKPYIAMGTGTGSLAVPDSCWAALDAAALRQPRARCPRSQGGPPGGRALPDAMDW